MARKKGPTPGPWEVEIGGNYLSIYQVAKMKNARRYLGRENGHVAGVKTPSMSSVTPYLPDAYLIAAAPEILEAVRATRNVIGNILTDSQLDTRTKCGKTLRQWWRLCEDAIKKADRWKKRRSYQ